MDLEFSAPMFEWRGPAPYHFVTVPDDEAEELRDAAAYVTYGWGMIPVTVRLGGSTWTTSLWPKDGGYIVPLKLAVRRAEGVEVDDVVTVRLTLDV